MNGSKTAEDSAQIVSRLSVATEAENVAENLIMELGFEDCVVYIDGDSADVVVKTSEGLTPLQILRIKEILLCKVDILNENIRIFEAK